MPQYHGYVRWGSLSRKVFIMLFFCLFNSLLGGWKCGFTRSFVLDMLPVIWTLGLDFRRSLVFGARPSPGEECSAGSFPEQRLVIDPNGHCA